MNFSTVNVHSAVIKRLPSLSFSKIGVTTSEGTFIVELDNIVYCEASGNYTILHLRDGKKIVSSKTLKVFDHHLPIKRFKRCHQSYLINTDYVTKIDDEIVMKTGVRLPVSRRRKKEVLSGFHFTYIML